LLSIVGWIIPLLVKIHYIPYLSNSLKYTALVLQLVLEAQIAQNTIEQKVALAGLILSVVISVITVLSQEYVLMAASFINIDMKYEKIMQDLKAGTYHPVYLLHGEESFFIDSVTSYIEKNAISEAERSFNQVVLYGKDVDFKAVVDNARQFPMMAQRRVVILKEAQAMRSLKDLHSYIEKPSPTTVFVIAHKNKPLDKRTKFGKAVSKSAVILDSKKLYDNQVPAWIANYAKSIKLAIDAEATRMLTEYLGQDLSKIVNEIDKIKINLKAGETITAKLVQDGVGISRDYNVFELNKALSIWDYPKIMRIIYYFEENPKANPLVMVISNLFGYFTKVAIAQQNLKASDGDLAKKTGVNPFFVKDYRVAARTFSPAQIKQAFLSLHTADRHSKGMGMKHATPLGIMQQMIFEIQSA